MCRAGALTFSDLGWALGNNILICICGFFNFILYVKKLLLFLAYTYTTP